MPDGWFVVNVADAEAKRHHIGGLYAPFESGDARFPQFGINIHVLQPGEPNSLYHRESAQEAFLVLHGEPLLIVEGEERRLRQWDFVYCPPFTTHVFVGAGAGPSAILMVGTRDPDEQVHYPVDETAARYNASAVEPSDDPAEAYAAAGWSDRLEPVPMPWPLD